MLDEFRSVGLTDAARRLGVDPFDVVRLLVADGRRGATLRFDHATIEHLRQLGRIEGSWWTGVSLPADPSPLRARVRAAVQLLQQRGHVGASQTRMDNTWRGLSPDEQDGLRRCLQALADDGVLDVHATSIGAMVSISPKALDQVQKLVAGGATPAALQAALEE
jgi:hypothetical protein